MGHNKSGLQLSQLARLAGKAALFLSLIGGLFIGVAPTVIACTCGHAFSVTHPCSSYWSSDAVFTGQVSEIERRQTEFADGVIGNRTVIAHFLVEEVFRGVSGKTLDVYTWSSGGECGYSFKRGERYIVYGRRNPQDGQIWTSHCSTTKPLAESAPDLEYARAVKRGETGGIIYGAAVQYKRAGAQRRGDHRKLARIPVIVEGQERSYNLFTDQDGKFQVGGVPDGTYRVRIKLPPNLPPMPTKETVIGVMKCAPVEFH